MSDEAAQEPAPVTTPTGLHTPEDFPVLTSARLVCRECFSSLGIDALVDLVRLVDGFLDTFSGPDAVQRGCELGYSVRALTYLAARDTDSFWGEEATKWAALRGHVHVLQWLNGNHRDRCEWTSIVMDCAACRGHLSAVQWLHENRSEGCSDNALSWAAGGGHVQVVQWLLCNRKESCTSGAIETAVTSSATSGQLGMVRWLHANCSQAFYPHTLSLAATSGSLPVVQWLYEHRGNPLSDTSEVLIAAARRGQLAVVKWLVEETSEGMRIYRDQADLAIQGAREFGHPHVEKWLSMQKNKRRRSKSL